MSHCSFLECLSSTFFDHSVSHPDPFLQSDLVLGFNEVITFCCSTSVTYVISSSFAKVWDVVVVGRSL